MTVCEAIGSAACQRATPNAISLFEPRAAHVITVSLIMVSIELEIHDVFMAIARLCPVEKMIDGVPQILCHLTDRPE